MKEADRKGQMEARQGLRARGRGRETACHSQPMFTASLAARLWMRTAICGSPLILSMIVWRGVEKKARRRGGAGGRAKCAPPLGAMLCYVRMVWVRMVLFIFKGYRRLLLRCMESLERFVCVCVREGGRKGGREGRKGGGTDEGRER